MIQVLFQNTLLLKYLLAEFFVIEEVGDDLPADLFSLIDVALDFRFAIVSEQNPEFDAGVHQILTEMLDGHGLHICNYPLFDEDLRRPHKVEIYQLFTIKE